MITYSQLGRHGNTGNSMFQFASLVGISDKCNYEFCVPTLSSYYDINYQCNNNSIFDGFDIKCNILPERDLLHFRDQYTEKYFHFDKDTFNIKDDTDLSGYFQTEKYFEHCKDKVYSYFQFKNNIKDILDKKINNKIYPDPLKCTAVHIRRGDYVHKQEFHPQLPLTYYKEACSITDTEKYIIFSDDIDWCKSTFGNHSKIIYSQDEDPFVAMYHMSLCTGHVICNSTFGWWGAWLSEMRSKKELTVVAPKLWFGTAHSNYNSKDIIPERWIKI